MSTFLVVVEPTNSLNTPGQRTTLVFPGTFSQQFEAIAFLGVCEGFPARVGIVGHQVGKQQIEEFRDLNQVSIRQGIKALGTHEPRSCDWVFLMCKHWYVSQPGANSLREILASNCPSLVVLPIAIEMLVLFEGGGFLPVRIQSFGW